MRFVPKSEKHGIFSLELTRWAEFFEFATSPLWGPSGTRAKTYAKLTRKGVGPSPAR